MNNIYNIDTSSALTAGRCKITDKITLSVHYHKQIELLYMIDGSLKFHANNKIYDLKKDSFVIIKSLDIHSFSDLEKHSKIFLLVLPDVFSLNLSDINIYTKVFMAPSKDIRKIISMFDDFKGLSEKYMFLYYQMFFEAIKDLFVVDTIDKESVKTKIIDFINKNFRQQLTLNNVAIACQTNRSYVSRAVNELYSLSFSQYVNRLRISYFLDVFINNSDFRTIEDIALSSGFSDIRTFYRAFKKELNCTPSEYIKLEYK